MSGASSIRTLRVMRRRTDVLLALFLWFCLVLLSGIIDLPELDQTEVSGFVSYSCIVNYEKGR